MFSCVPFSWCHGLVCDCGILLIVIAELLSSIIYKLECANSRDSNHPVHLHRPVLVFRVKKRSTKKCPSKTLIRLCRCTSWSESLIGAHTNLYLLLDIVLYVNKTELCSGPASLVHIFNVWTIIMQSLNIKERNLFELQITQKFHNVNILKVA